MDFNIPADIKGYLGELDEFIEREIKPLERENDNIRFFDHRREWARTDFERGGLPRHEWEALLAEMRRRADRAGHYRFALPKEFGGKDGSNLAMAIIREHLAAKGLGLHNDLQNESSIVANLPIVLMFRDFGTAAQKQKFIPGILDGSINIAFGLTEPEHGSDATWMETRGVREGDGWRINGEKIWNTGLHVATHDLVFARTSGRDGGAKGITCFIVPVKTAGFKIEEYLWTFNMPTDHPRISLKEVAVPADAILGDPEDGLAVAQHFVHENRIRQAASSLGAAQFCINEAVKYANERKPFGRPLAVQSGDPVAAGRAAHRSRNDPRADPQDRVGDGPDVQAGGGAAALRQGFDVQLPREPAGLRGGGSRDAGAWAESATRGTSPSSTSTGIIAATASPKAPRRSRSGGSRRFCSATLAERADARSEQAMFILAAPRGLGRPPEQRQDS